MIEIDLAMISSVLIGILASYVASKIFLYSNNKQNKPNILISDKLIRSKRKDGTKSLKVKLINKTDQDLVNVHIEVEAFSNLSPRKYSAYISKLFD
jgi:mannitol-specific phosphotransferase system IIBC component